MQIRWTEKANRNLDDVEAYLALDNCEAAIRMVLKIIRAVEQLLERPALGRPGRVHGTRELVIGGTPFMVPYRVRGEVLEILAVLHGSGPTGFETRNRLFQDSRKQPLHVVVRRGSAAFHGGVY